MASDATTITVSIKDTDIFRRMLETIAKLRCEKTKNPIGTDTWAADYRCPCQCCQMYVELTEVVASFRK